MPSDFEETTPHFPEDREENLNEPGEDTSSAPLPHEVGPLETDDERHILEATTPLEPDEDEGITYVEPAGEYGDDVRADPVLRPWFANPKAPNDRPADPYSNRQPPFVTDGTPPRQATTPKEPKPESAGEKFGKLAVVALLASALGAGATYEILESQGQTIGDRTVTVDRAQTIDGMSVDRALESIFTVAVRAGETGGGGSGVAIDKTHIVTNAHVVTLGGKIQSESGTVEVQDSTGQEYAATILGVDETADVAVLEVKGADFTPLKWSEGKPRVGEAVLAMGSPLGLADTVTDGIVSAVDRPVSLGAGSNDEGMITEASTFINAIQTDAAINSGNSGGALIDAQGNLLGLNVAISSTRGNTGSIGIGYAIPASYAKRVALEIIARGEASHGLLGVSITTDRSKGGSFENGARIEEFSENSPAQAADLKINDVIVEVNGASITSAGGLTAAIKELAPGAQATIIVERGNGTREFKVAVAGE